MKKIFLVVPIIIISGLFIFSTTKITSKENKNNHYKYPTSMDFANEVVPFYVADVQERLDREMVVNMNYHSNTTLVIKRAHKIFPIIEPILKANNIPDDFKYLAVIESGLINVVSPAGAKGIWQFMPTTAKENGMEVSTTVDERYHLEKATQAACNYLNEAKAIFGSWTLAAASYNAGMNGIKKRLKEQQVSQFYDLLLNDETSRYVFRILALKEIMKNPEKYGFFISEEMKYKQIPVRYITVDSTINNLATFAKEQGINYKILKIHNPWLRDKKLLNTTKKMYKIAIPTSGYKPNNND